MSEDFNDLDYLTMDFESTLPSDLKTSTKKKKKKKSECLQRGFVVNERYKVIKVISSKENRATYLVKDIKITDKNFILREIEPPKMSQGDLKERVQKFQEIIRILSSFKHKHLMEVYEGFSENHKEYAVMEYVEGLDLKKLTTMSASYPPFQQEKVVQWGLDLCEAMEFLHVRPKPFTLGDFDPDKIIVDEEGTLNIISYDLQRFFDTNRTLEFMPDDSEKLYEDITKLSQVIYFMMTGKTYEKDSPEFPDEITPKFKKLLEITCMPNQMSIGSIKEFKKRLENVLVPDKEESFETEERVWPTVTVKFDPVYIAKEAWYGFLKQNPLIILLEIIFVLFLLSYGYFNRTKVYVKPPNKELTYIISGGDLYTVGFVKKKDYSLYEPLNTKPLSFKSSGLLTLKLMIPENLKIGDIQKPGVKLAEKEVLLLSDGGRGIINLFDTNNNKVIGFISTEPGPGLMITDDEGKYLFTIHTRQSSISLINLKTLFLQNVFPTGLSPVSMAYIPLTPEEKSKLKTGETKEEDKTGKEVKTDNKGKGNSSKLPSPTLAVSCRDSRQIIFLNAINGKEKFSVSIEGKPGKILLSPDRQFLYALDIERNRLLRINIATQKYVEFTLVYEGAVDMEMDPNTGKIWIVHTKLNQVVPFDTKSDKFGDSVVIKRLPFSITFHNGKLWILNRGTKDIIILDSDGAIYDKISLDRVPVFISFSLYRENLTNDRKKEGDGEKEESNKTTENSKE